MPRLNEGLKGRWKKEDFLCLSLSSTVTRLFLRRNHQVRKMSSAIFSVKPITKKARTASKSKRKLKRTTSTREAHIHTLFRGSLYSYVRKSESGFPCPFCGSKTYTEDGLWTHLMTSKGAHLHLVPNRDCDGTLHIAINKRDPQAEIQILESPSYLAGETEVIFLKKFNWRSKRYNPGGQVMVFHRPAVELRTKNAGNQRDEVDDGKADGKPVWGEETIPVSDPMSDKEQRGPLSDYYLYDEYTPLSDALRKHQDEDPPPKRQYFHVCSRQPISMGEWMLCSDSHGLPASNEWRQHELDERAGTDFSDISDSEKRFIRCWNAVVQRHASLREFNVARVCRQMLQQFGARLPEKVWQAHLLNLCEVRQLCRADSLVLMREYHEQNAAKMALLGATHSNVEG